MGYVLVGAIAFGGLSGAWASGVTLSAAPVEVADISSDATILSNATVAAINQQISQGRELYRAGRFAEAIAVWSGAVDASGDQGNTLQQVVLLSYLSLAHQQMGQLDQATEAIERGQQGLQNFGGSRSDLRYDAALAQLLNTQGSLYFTQGQEEEALTTWQQATAAYARAGDETNRINTLINQAQAQQALGLYLQAQRTLTDVERSLQQQTDPDLQVAGLNSLGNVLRLIGNLDQSRDVLQRGLERSQQASSQNRSLILFSLGNTARSQEDWDAALSFYQQGASQASPLLAVQARLNQLSLLVETKRFAAAETLATQLAPELEQLPISRSTIYARINYAQSLTRLTLRQQETASIDTTTAFTRAAQQLALATQQAQTLGDVRAEAYAEGHLAGVYEQTQQWAIAQRLTEQALLLAQANNTPDIAYQWQWQLGRILKAQNQPERAIIAYKAAYETLQTLRSDLVAIDPSVQFSFRESVEPVYREYVNLLLQGNGDERTKLKQAREVIESLQLAELTNFFRSACLEGQIVALDQVDQTEAAVIYPIILPDRLEIILSLPKQPLQRYTSAVSQEQIETTVEQFRQALERPFTTPEGRQLGQQIYQWMIRPMESVLAQNQVKVLVFVLDGALRNVPMAALHTGNGYLIQNYAVAIAPGLQLLNPQPLRQQNLEVLAAGLTEERDGFSPLDYVGLELEQIQAKLPSRILLNQAFTSTALQDQINTVPFPIVHLATHGQFSSNLDDTFILAWDKRILIDELSSLLRASDETRPVAIELLVLSACETAAGDKRATLGLAGIAVQAGARSTLASLWTIDDASSARLISQFYQELATANVTKAEALRRAQLSLLQDADYRHPVHWASYVLIGNWL
ncbi:CHAT domain-containing protein [Oscillatoria sp. FACHB-1407]|nr:CHAT domain-containing protein [Oscillatoria sp. FACHB-1407]